ncbi:hypothetical protein Nepgr_033781 [Nepenthes gracilis]|uniref:Uncharacterized protein n=1 Tax=Nepenthes gracilis TaxID=150966 RepID=A0AAD3TN14_NEPGR|nr:hypothetical protein Nepgr_033781 [Nepenthes gracilis]
MELSFCARVSASTTHTWTTLPSSGADDVRVMTQKSIEDPRKPLRDCAKLCYFILSSGSTQESDSLGHSFKWQGCSRNGAHCKWTRYMQLRSSTTRESCHWMRLSSEGDHEIR